MTRNRRIIFTLVLASVLCLLMAKGSADEKPANEQKTSIVERTEPADAPEDAPWLDQAYQERFELYGADSYTQIPAFVGRFIMDIPGVVTWSLFALPFYVIPDPEHSSDQFARDTFMLSDLTFGYVGYVIVGAPCRLVEAICWDGPCYLFNLAFGESTPEEPVKPEIAPAKGVDKEEQ